MTRRSDVCVSENDTTLLSTNPASSAAAITSVSRIVAALPLRDTTQIAPLLTMLWRRSCRSASSAIESAARETTSTDSFGAPSSTAVVLPRRSAWKSSAKVPTSAMRESARTPSLSSSGRVETGSAGGLMCDPTVRSTDMPRHTNRLAQETSPYLLQHAHNPVDWYAWGAEALERARAEDKPIFLSIGYAACHWCHVMERESFENEETARVLNEAFVPIKVDREERPDLDSIYMDAVQQMTGSGGWPMSVFLTPDGKPFYGGTYFPDEPRHGLPSFTQVLEGVGAAWRERREEVERAGTALAQAISGELASASRGVGGNEIGESLLDEALLSLERGFDARRGGWGGAPKFPQPMTIEFLLRLHVKTRDQRPLAMARRTLDAMSAGGIYDHLGGGFARYATDAVWLVPHFEKMLYDNAQLARVYVHAWQLTHEPRYRQVAEETLDFVARELRTADGGFAASLDADTDGEEGATYVWDKAEIDALLGDQAAAFGAAYAVTDNGNWEGRTILRRAIGSGDDQDL